MKLTPLDLQQKTFRKARLGGVDEREVKAFLELAATELEDCIRKIHAQDEELRRSKQRIEEYREREQLLQQTLTTAQKMSDDMKATTRKQADIVLSDAELQAEKIIATAQARRLQLLTEIEELKRTRAHFLSQVSSVIDAHKSLLDTMRAAAEADQTRPPPPRGVPTPQPSRPPPPPAAAFGENVSFLQPPAKREG